METTGMRINSLMVILFVAVLFFVFSSSCQADEKTAVPQPGAAAVQSDKTPADAGSSSAAKTTGPRITFESVLHDFGDIGPTTSHKCEFKFTNTGDEILNIGRIKATCGCTVPKLSKNNFAPGETGTVKINSFNGLYR